MTGKQKTRKVKGEAPGARQEGSGTETETDDEAATSE